LVSKNNVVLAGMITVSLTVIGAILSDVFSPLAESLKDTISPVQDALIRSATIFSNENRSVSTLVTDGQNNVSSTAITFNLEPNKTLDKYHHFLFVDYSLFNLVSYLFPDEVLYQYQCSIDGQPFEDCLSPKSYGNLHTEQMHIFKVRTKGILGNTQDIPETFRFTTVTSSSIQGFLWDNSSKPVPKMQVKVDNSSIQDNTDNAGYFSFDGIGQGRHILYFTNPALQSNRYHTIFVPSGLPWMDLEKIIYNDMAIEQEFVTSESGVVKQNVQQPSEFDPEADNPSFSEANNQSNVYVANDTNIIIESNSTKKSPSENLFQTEFWVNASTSILDNIKNVSYYLHPTFTPDVISSDLRNDFFKVKITNWGIFDLRARVLFNDGRIQDLQLPAEKWVINT
jgi:YEATS family